MEIVLLVSTITKWLVFGNLLDRGCNKLSGLLVLQIERQ